MYNVFINRGKHMMTVSANLVVVLLIIMIRSWLKSQVTHGTRWYLNTYSAECA